MYEIGSRLAKRELRTLGRRDGVPKQWSFGSESRRGDAWDRGVCRNSGSRLAATRRTLMEQILGLNFVNRVGKKQFQPSPDVIVHWPKTAKVGLRTSRFRGDLVTGKFAS